MSLRTALIIASVIGLALPVSAEAQSSARTTANLKLRAGPDINHSRILGMPHGAQVHVLQCTSGNWCQVTYAGMTGWASQRYLDIGPAMRPPHIGSPASPPAGMPAVRLKTYAAPQHQIGISRWPSAVPSWHNVVYWDGQRHRDAWHYEPARKMFYILLVR